MDDFIRILELKFKDEQTLLAKLKKRARRLDRYKGDRLHIVRQRNKTAPSYYIHHQGEPQKCRHYCSKDKISDVKNIQEYAYLKKSIAYCERNIKLIGSLKSAYHSAYPDDVLPELGQAYQDQEQIKEYLFQIPSNESWVKEQLELKAKYLKAHPDKFESQLCHRTCDGEYTRSKSELDIYHLLTHLGCTFIYEMPVQLLDRWYVCDFMVLLPNGKLLIIEHMGLAGDPGYLSRKLNVLESFIKSGWIPNVNLLLTFEDSEGHIDMQAITKLIMAYVA